MWFRTLSLSNVLPTVRRKNKPENVSGISEALLPLSLSLPKRAPCPWIICLLKSSWLFSASPRLIHSNSHGSQEVLGDFLVAFSSSRDTGLIWVISTAAVFLGKGLTLRSESHWMQLISWTCTNCWKASFLPAKDPALCAQIPK